MRHRRDPLGVNVGAIGFERGSIGIHFNPLRQDAELKLGIHAHDVVLVGKNVGSDETAEKLLW